MKLNKMPKEELELLSYTKIAELYLKENKKTLNTADLFKEVCKLLDLSENEYQEKIADFFQSLTTSKEFILLKDGNWDLRSNHTVKINIDEIYEEKDDDEEIGEDEDDNGIPDDLEDEEYDSSIEDDYDDEDLGDLTVLDEENLDE